MYKKLKKERTKDENATNKKSPKCRKSGRGEASKKTVGKAQKRFLNCRLNVAELLEAVDAKSRERLESFTIARIVRVLQDAEESL